MTEFDPISGGTDKLLRKVRESRRHSLEQIDGEGSPRQFILKPGKASWAAPDVHVYLPSHSASRHHALLKVRGTDCILYDNDSHNGISLNGVEFIPPFFATGM